MQLAELIADSDTENRLTELSKQAVPYRSVAYPHGVIHVLAEDARRAADAWTNMVGLESGELNHLADLLREIAGNPFVPIPFDQSLAAWRDGTIPKLAQACYDSNDFSMIGILADALEEAGCNEPTILEHARSKQAHYRGCWMVDLILGAE